VLGVSVKTEPEMTPGSKSNSYFSLASAVSPISTLVTSPSDSGALNVRTRASGEHKALCNEVACIDCA